ncbi:hypothetical protein E0L36_10505 [Streptomyces sp. AJS327]|uniref:hypothetical protein n=1 Tax=Streptomyces sp. AJS327 TaxID=2545265 RepID=UPI0015DD7276|nr:hypothetical protein [Streptomyces sp. AJS327]MBA0051305.1 hypothetical protein [Streptomyces sp. AJS327]
MRGAAGDVDSRTGDGGELPAVRRRSGGLFPLLVAWAAGIAVFCAAGLLSDVLLSDVADAERLSAVGWRLTLIHLPNLLIATGAALAAARAHRRPYRASLLWHLAATAGVPLLALARALAEGGALLATEGAALMATAALLGGGAGLALDALLEGRRAARGSGVVWDGTSAPPSWRDGRWERGATGVEYLGAVFVVLSMVLAVSTTGIGEAVGQRFQCALSKLTERGYGAGGKGGSAKGSATRTATVTVNRDPETDRLRSLIITRTTQRKGGGAASGERKTRGGKDGGKVSGGGGRQATRTDTDTDILSFQDGKPGVAKQRAVAEDWLSGDLTEGPNSTIFTLFSGIAPEKDPKAGADSSNS